MSQSDLQKPDLPKHMQAIEIRNDREKPYLALGETALPEFGPEDVLVRVRASGSTALI